MSLLDTELPPHTILFIKIDYYVLGPHPWLRPHGLPCCPRAGAGQVGSQPPQYLTSELHPGGAALLQNSSFAPGLLSFLYPHFSLREETDGNAFEFGNIVTSREMSDHLGMIPAN